MSIGEIVIRVILTLDVILLGILWGREMWDGIDADSFVFGFFKAAAVVAVGNIALAACFGVCAAWAMR